MKVKMKSLLEAIDHAPIEKFFTAKSDNVHDLELFQTDVFFIKDFELKGLVNDCTYKKESQTGKDYTNIIIVKGGLTEEGKRQLKILIDK